MPELPEVETIVRALRDGGRDGPSLLQRRIQASQVLWERTLAEPLLDEFSTRIQGQTVQALNRRAKYILIQLDQDTLIIHLRMSGDLRVEPHWDQQGQPIPLAKHDRLALIFEDGLRLAFNDTRKFGRAWLVQDPQTILAGLGPEPFDPALTPEDFYQRLSGTHRQLKPLLLDQSFIAGLGNIYTDEALHLAGLHPLTHSASLTPDQASQLLAAIRSVLEEGIRHNGASIDWVYRGGNFQNTFRAYGQTGKPCPVCGTTIARILVGQRSSHYCPTCQPRYRPSSF